MRTRSLLLASALVLASGAGTLALSGIQPIQAADDAMGSKASQSVQQQGANQDAAPATNRDDRRTGQARGDGDDMRRGGDSDDTGAVPTSQQAMPLEDIIRQLSQQGYSDIREVEREGRDRYEVYARDQNGKRVEIKVDAMTGKVLARERDD